MSALLIIDWATVWFELNMVISILLRVDLQNNSDVDFHT